MRSAAVRLAKDCPDTDGGAGTPDATVKLLNQELRKIVQQPDVIQRLVDLGGEPQASTPAEFRQFVEQDFRKWQQLIDLRKIERQ